MEIGLFRSTGLIRCGGSVSCMAEQHIRTSRFLFPSRFIVMACSFHVLREHGVTDEQEADSIRINFSSTTPPGMTILCIVD